MVDCQRFEGSVTRAGELEVVLDRRLMQDDDRGLGQGVTDNKLTPSLYHLLLEDRRGVAQVCVWVAGRQEGGGVGEISILGELLL